MRAGSKTAEFAIIALGGLLGILYSQIWPDRPFPLDTFITLSIWVGARFVEKVVGPADTGGKRFWQTSEFWVMVGGVCLTIVEVFLPHKIPDVILMMAWGYMGGRPVVKATSNFQLGPAKTEPPSNATDISGA